MAFHGKELIQPGELHAITDKQLASSSMPYTEHNVVSKAESTSSIRMLTMIQIAEHFKS